jgi:hypothetical protein
MREVQHAGASGEGNPSVEHSAEENRVAVPPVQKPLKTKNCRICHRPFIPRLSTAACCSVDCAIQYSRYCGKGKVSAARQRLQAAELKEAKKAKAEYRKKSMSLSKLKNLAQREVNRWIRHRDRNLGCISCHMPASYAGPWHAGHYRSRGAADHLRFNEDNLAKQCSQCNEHKSGNAVEYRKGLIARIGLARVEALENDNRVHRWTREELTAIRKDYHDRFKAEAAQ